MVYEYDDYITDTGQIFSESVFLYLEDGNNTSLMGALGNAIHSIIKSFKDFLVGLLGGGKNKSDCQQIDDALQKNPSLANKKIKYDNYSEQNKTRASFLGKLKGAKTEDDVDRFEDEYEHQMAGVAKKGIGIVGTIGLALGANKVWKEFKKSRGNAQREADLMDPDAKRVIDECEDILRMSTSDIAKSNDQKVEQAYKINPADKKRIQLAEKILKDTIGEQKKAQSGLFSSIKSAAGMNTDATQDTSSDAQMHQHYMSTADDTKTQYYAKSKSLQEQIKKNREKIKKLEKSRRGANYYYKEIRTLKSETADLIKQLQNLGTNTAKDITATRGLDRNRVDTIIDKNKKR